MNRMEFIDKLFSLYSNSWNERNKDLKQEQYFLILKRDNIDYNRLYDVISEENMSEFMPQPAWIKERIPRCLKRGANQQWLNVEVLDPRSNTVSKKDCFPIGTTIEQMIKTYEQKFQCTGWRILKVY